MTTIVLTFVSSGVLAFILGASLGFFKEKFKVERDPTIDNIRALLPGVNCGGCGYPGCDGYAEAVAAGNAPVTRCAPGGKAVSSALGELLGVSASAEEVTAVLLCHGTLDKAQRRGEYVGIKSCKAAKISAGSTKLCSYGCVGLGDCTVVCKFDAIHVGEDGLPHVNYEKCTGCGMCVKECPQKLLVTVPKSRVGSIVLCSNRSTLKSSVAKNCKVGCIKCESCVRVCPEQCISMVNGIPVTDYTKCTSCGLCVEKCPTKCYKLIDDTRLAYKKA